MKYIIRCFLLAFVSILSTGVLAQQQEQQINFVEFKDDIGTRGETQTMRTFKTQSSYKSYFGHNAPAEVDFSRQWVVFFSAGSKKTNGYSASITKISISVGGRTLKIITSLSSPGTNCKVSENKTKPFVLVTLKIPSNIEFIQYYKDDKIRSCPELGLPLNKLLTAKDSAMDSNKWVITPSGTRGATGNVTIALPEGTTWYMLFKTTENRNLTQFHNTKSHVMIAGTYNIDVTYIPVPGVPVQKGMNTRIKAGVLNVVVTGQWTLYNEDKTKAYTSYYQPTKVGLPIGKYNIQINGQYQLVEIKDGEVTEF